MRARSDGAAVCAAVVVSLGSASVADSQHFGDTAIRTLGGLQFGTLAAVTELAMFVLPSVVLGAKGAAELRDGDLDLQLIRSRSAVRWLTRKVRQDVAFQAATISASIVALIVVWCTAHGAGLERLDVEALLFFLAKSVGIAVVISLCLRGIVLVTRSARAVQGILLVIALGILLGGPVNPLDSRYVAGTDVPAQVLDGLTLVAWLVALTAAVYVLLALRRPRYGKLMTS